MSPDDILAANLWPWPDPLLKRDRNGNLIFVNAAFLQLYGGRVEDWFGRSVSGWPTPNLQGPQRFETRAGEAPNQTVYDWVETVMADGNTMAIARDVTIFMTPPVQEDIPSVVTPPETVSSPRQAINTPPPQNTQPSLSQDLEDTLNNDADDYSYENKAPATPPTPTPSPTPEPTPILSELIKEEPEERRMIERRALPIEDSENVLGTNWRDEVIAKAMQGSATSASGVSPTQTLKPKTVAQETKETQEPEDIKHRAGLHILLAEDNAINALLTRTLLEAEGATVETVEDGLLAVEAVRKNEYDLIFMDMRMPVMDGLESTRKIRGLGKTMPIIALTANAFDDDRNSCFDSGMNDFMTKPVSAEELSEMVATWVRNKNEQEKLAS
ncbi:MAG: response regulator [Robiginitomaculum sp.]|nr:response regulator [Robiginitomaculum sp.]